MSFAEQLLKNPSVKVAGDAPAPSSVKEAWDEDEDTDHYTPPCPACSSEGAVPLGAMGRLEWYRCRRCGIDFSSDNTTKAEGAWENRGGATSPIKSLKSRINEAVGKSLILSEHEVMALKQYLRETEFDPFKDAKPILTTQDLSKLGLELDNDGLELGDEDETPKDPFDENPESNGGMDGSRETRPDTSVATDRIGAELAIVAPDATPNHESPIPQSVLQALDVLNGKEPEKPVAPTAPVAAVSSPEQAPKPVEPSPVAAVEHITSVMENYRRSRKNTTVPRSGGGESTPITENANVTGDANQIGSFMNKFRKAVKRG